MNRGSGLNGNSSNAIFLTLVKLVTMAMGLVTTRLLSQYLTTYDYGTYSQVLLVSSTLCSFTILGMMDGVNYFYCGESNIERREAYVSTIYSLQCIASAVGALAIMGLEGTICSMMRNEGLRPLLIFSAVMPFFQNILSITQVLILSVGKARLLAIRNFVVSLLRTIIVLVVVLRNHNVFTILSLTMLLDIAQIVFFYITLMHEGCYIRLEKSDYSLVPQILHYTVPMAVFVMLNTLNRDCDKYIISVLTDTETMAVYANAAKILPFDIIQTSFITVLLPQITRMISESKQMEVVSLYRRFLEISYISTGVMAGAALAVAPQLMQLLYTEKYLSGVWIFRIYILVDLMRFASATLLLSASGKTKTLMWISVGSVVANLLLNLCLFKPFGIVGPALATLFTTTATGVIILHFGAEALGTSAIEFFDSKYLASFTIQALLAFCVSALVTYVLTSLQVFYVMAIPISVAIYVAIMCPKNVHRFLDDLHLIEHVEH